jgi:homoserine kinase
VIGGNNLLGSPYRRDELLEISAQISRPDSAVTTMIGGLSTSLMNGDDLIYRTLPLAAMRVALVLPEIAHYPRPAPLERVPMAAALHNLSRLPLLTEALRTGDLKLLATGLDDAVQMPRLIAQIPAYAQIVEAAQAAGASVVTPAGDGPAVMAFADRNHAQIAAAMQAAFQYVGVEARVWVVPVDTQGVVISVVGT